MRDLLPGRDGRAGLGVSRVCRTLPGLLVVALLTLGHPSLAAADSIYLKNGRVIRTPRTEVVGDKLVFLQYGAEITIPMDLVDRIELDDQIEEAPSPPRQPSPQGSESADGTEVDAENSAEDGAEGSEEDEGPAEDTRAFWRGRVEEIAAERAGLQEQIVEYRREERAFLFSHRSTAETRVKIEAAQQRIADGRARHPDAGPPA